MDGGLAQFLRGKRRRSYGAWPGGTTGGQRRGDPPVAKSLTKKNLRGEREFQ
jgi:hypothetical protein